MMELEIYGTVVLATRAMKHGVRIVREYIRRGICWTRHCCILFYL